MGNNFVPEISSYFQHEDYSLAIRRLLDVCLDINKSALIQNAIDLSKIYHSTVKDNPVASKEFLNAANDLIQQISSETVTFPSSELLVNVEQVSKTYTNGNFTLNPISFRVSTGDILGVVGENGNGKTTLLRCLAGQLAI